MLCCIYLPSDLRIRCLQSLENLDICALGGKLYDGFLGLGGLAYYHAPSLLLAVIVHGVDALYLHAVKHLLDSFLGTHL